jgi:hypothetical protein
MSRWASAFALLLGLLVGTQTASAAPSKVVLTVEGMT